MWTEGTTHYLEKNGKPEVFDTRELALAAGNAVLLEAPESSFVVESDRIGYPED